MKPYAEFAYFQKDHDLGQEFRCYLIKGDHRLDGSHVSIKTVVDEGIEIPDLTPEEIAREYIKIVDYLKVPK